MRKHKHERPASPTPLLWVFVDAQITHRIGSVESVYCISGETLDTLKRLVSESSGKETRDE